MPRPPMMGRGGMDSSLDERVARLEERVDALEAAKAPPSTNMLPGAGAAPDPEDEGP
jgi:hypothetical protein